ncbi:MAG: mechanosensitive ion channel family protein [Acidobacteriia bacterium]|nr:mechanosensitive ion channel family protein [Terriglobia bacterium]
MKSIHRVLLTVLSLLLAGTGAGLFLTSNWGNRAVSKRQPNRAESPVDMHQMQTAMSLAPLAATAEEQDRARDAMRAADHEVDFEFAAALYRATFQKVPSTPEINAVQMRILNAIKSVADINADIERITKQLAAAGADRKPALSQQLELANARLELNQDELDDAKEDLERAGGDPQSRIQRLIDEHKASAQDTNGELDLSSVGKVAGSTIPVSNSFLPRARAWFALRSFVQRLDQAEQGAVAKAAEFSSRHDELEKQLEQAQSEQRKKLPEAQSGTQSGGPAGGNSAAIRGSTPDQTVAAISSYRSLTALQKRMSSMDTRIRNQQDLAAAYEQWGVLAAARERDVLHSLFVSLAFMLLIGLCALIADRSLESLFNRLEPDRKNLLTLRAVSRIATRALGAILILLVIFGLPTQMATVLALAGAGLTVALKDFIVGFFGWFVLMGKNGIRHGDWVEINGVSGEVVEIGLFHTVLLETGNWNDSGHPTGRRVTFVNSYAIEGHYFNFSTSGQWLWDEMEIMLPADRDPYPVAAEMQKIVAKETEANAHLAEQEWERMGTARGVRAFSAGPAISVRPAGLGFEILLRYVTRANERYQQRSKLYFEIVELLRRKNIPQPAAPPPADTPSAATA